MKAVLSRAQSRAFDRVATDKCHLPGVVLMENAGRGAAELVVSRLPRPDARVVILCGTGNNGGDGFVVARHLLCRGVNVEVIVVGSGEGVRGDAQVNRDAYLGLEGPYRESGGDPNDLGQSLATADVIVDALFGTGLDRDLREPFPSVIAVLNDAPGRRLALDLPSGLDADTGAVRGAVVRAHETITFGCWKAGLLTPHGASYAGHIHLVGLGVPDSLVLHTGQRAHLLDAPVVRSWLQPRPVGTYKHQQGSVVVVAGSPGKTGAALLTATACLRAGAGLCTLATWDDGAAAAEGRLPWEIMTARLRRADLSASLQHALAEQRVAAVGPGLGLDAAARHVVDYVVHEREGVTVLDADALTHYAGRAAELAAARGRLILTPHAGELGRLLGRPSADIESDRFEAVRRAAEITRAVVVLKGAHSLVAFGDEGLLVNNAGNAVLATAGSGDVLTGIIAALACTLLPEQAAAAGVYIHAVAADRWRADHAGADRGLLVSELTAYLPAVLASLQSALA